MKVENATGKLLALTSKCGNKHATLEVAIDLVEEIYREQGSCGTCIYSSISYTDVPTCSLVGREILSYCSEYEETK